MPRSRPPISTTATARRSCTRISTWSGHWRLTSALRTSASAWTRARIWSRSRRASGSPAGTRATDRICAAPAVVAPVTCTPLTARTEEKYTTQTPVASRATSSSTATTYFQASQRRAHWRRANRRLLCRASRSAGGAAPEPGRRNRLGIGGTEQVEHPGAQLGDAAGPQGEDQVAGPGARDELRRNGVEVGDEGHLLG